MNYQWSKKQIARVLLTLLAILITSNYLLSEFAPKEPFPVDYAAYRGGGQPLLVDNEAECAASTAVPLLNNYVQNTLDAAQEAINSGATALHLNVQRTADDKLIVFHDADLKCMTQAAGLVANTAYATIKELDPGYNLQEVNSRQYHWRGKYPISLLSEYIDRFPQVRYIINPKVTDEKTIRLIEEQLNRLPIENNAKSFYMGSEKINETLSRINSSRKLATIPGSKKCVMDYLLWGWFGHVPASCRDQIIIVPASKIKYLWGWPYRLNNNMRHAGSEWFLWSVAMDDKQYGADISIITSDVAWAAALHK